MKIYVTGISGAGKSKFAKYLASKLGYRYVDVDKIGHQAYEDSEVMTKLTEAFGSDIFDEQGKFDRHKLGKIVFSEKDSERVKIFNDVTWKFIRGQLVEILKDEDIVLDWQLLPITDFWEDNAVKILIKVVDQNKRFDKIVNRDNLDKEYITMRNNSGLDFDQYKFDFVYENFYDEADMKEAVDKIFLQLCNKI